jgi:hypothetical protein
VTALLRLFWEENKVENKACTGAFSIPRRHSRAACASQPYFQPYFSSQNNLSSKWFRMIFLNLITLFFCHRFRRVRNVLVGY